jgi:transposase
MGKLIAADYEQTFLLPPSLEEWVPADHPARFIREFVEQLDLEQLGFVMPQGEQGRPAYAPDLLLKIWLYGYFQRIRSTRKLEMACREHLSLLWLTTLIQPDHNSLWRFWKNNREPLRTVFKQTVQVAARSGCVGFVLQALDGTKIAAACSHYTGWSKEHMEKLLAALDEALATNELQVETQNAEQNETEGYRLPAGLSERRTLRDQIKAGLEQLAADGRKHYHPKEAEARRMGKGGENRYAYNAQAVTDQKSGILTACETTREETDHGQLVPLIEQARENLGVAATAVETLADTGYGAGADLERAAERGLAVLVPPAEGAPPKATRYPSRDFNYDKATRTVTCPQSRQLDYEGTVTRDGRPVERYRCHHRDCPVRAQCTQDPKGRQITVHTHTAAVQTMRARLSEPAAAARFARRGQLAELTFARIKQHDGFRRWTVWGLEAVRTQWALVCAVANLRILYQRWRRIKPTKPTLDGAAAMFASGTAA